MTCTPLQASDKAFSVAISNTKLTPYEGRSCMYQLGSIDLLVAEFKNRHGGGIITLEIMKALCAVRGVDRVYLEQDQLRIYAKQANRRPKIIRRIHEILAPLFEEELALDASAQP